MYSCTTKFTYLNLAAHSLAYITILDVNCSRTLCCGVSRTFLTLPCSNIKADGVVLMESFSAWHTVICSIQFFTRRAIIYQGTINKKS